MKNRVTSLTRQSGVVLVVSLVMLLLLTLIGLTGTQVTSLEEKMASNKRDQNVAFQAAESGLRGGEAIINTIVSLNAFDGDDGLLGQDDDKHDFSLLTTWTNDANSVEFDSGIAQVATQPRYFIKYLTTGDDNTGSSINLGGYGAASAGGAVSYFTVTSRGTGGQDSSQIYLQSHFAKRF
ncbi:MAG: pilus assembly protein PilX [Gammaproteobacteria bacterium]|nr:pilus assembly protein PilX [Gammaproteobacteria bacterium]